MSIAKGPLPPSPTKGPLPPSLEKIPLPPPPTKGPLPPSLVNGYDAVFDSSSVGRPCANADEKGEGDEEFVENKDIVLPAAAGEKEDTIDLVDSGANGTDVPEFIDMNGRGGRLATLDEQVDDATAAAVAAVNVSVSGRVPDRLLP